MPAAVQVPALPNGSGNGARASVKSRVGPVLSWPDREFMFGFWVLWHFFLDLAMPQVASGKKLLSHHQSRVQTP